MYAKGKGSTVPSDGQAREKYVSFFFFTFQPFSFLQTKENTGWWGDRECSIFENVFRFESRV